MTKDAWGEFGSGEDKPLKAGKAWSDKGRRTAEWRPENYLLVDGIPCLYTVRPDAIVVHLPGRINVILSVLKKQHKITEPRVWRVTVFNRESHE